MAAPLLASSFAMAARFSVLSVLLIAVAAQSPPTPPAPVRYTLAIADRAEHTARVTAEFPTAGRRTLTLFLPTWSPGFYQRQAYHERVLSLRATAGGQELAVERPQANRWQIATNGAEPVVVTYTLRADRRSVTENQVDDDFAIFCGPATWLGEVGQLARPHHVAVQLPDGWRDSVCSLPAGDAPHTFVAHDYDWLLDSPLLLGTVAPTTFDVLGSRHEWVPFGPSQTLADAGFDTTKLVARLQPIASELCRTFGGPPFARYVFLVGFRSAYGGLEHLDSTLVSVQPGQPADDVGLLSFLAHEYAHAFNVKRLRPRELGPFDYENPPATASLWISEGLTTWLGDLALARSGAIDVATWLALQSNHVRALQSSPGRHRQTLADASLAVWNGTTSGVGGDPRTTISYYVKGPVVGLLLEARLRVATDGERGLDDLLRAAYARWSGAVGFTAAEFEALAAERAGSDQRAFFDRALRSTEELDYSEMLAWFGLQFAAVAEPAGDAAPKAEGAGGEDRAAKAMRWLLELRPDATAAQQAHLKALLAPTPK